jgi:hypothetical protein
MHVLVLAEASKIITNVERLSCNGTESFSGLTEFEGFVIHDEIKKQENIQCIGFSIILDCWKEVVI